MHSSETVILDCGTNRTALGVFSRNGERIRLDRFAMENLPAGDDGEENWRVQTQGALKRLRLRLDAPAPVAVILPAQFVLLKFLKAPDVPPAQRDKIIRFQAEQSLPVSLDEVVWDSMVAAEGNSGLEVLLAAAKRESVNSLCSAVQSAGLDPHLILPSPLAILAAFRLGRPVPASPVLILDLGVRAASFLLVEGEGFVARTLTLGDSITRRPGVDEPPAEAGEAFAMRIVQEYTRVVLHFRRQGDWPKPAMIYLSGVRARLGGLNAILADKLQLPIEYLEMTPAAETAPGVEGGSPEDLIELFGAAATQLSSKQPWINLLPATWRRRQRLHRRQSWLITAIAMVASTLLPPLAHFHALAAEARQKTSAIEQAIAPMREREARNRVTLARIEQVKEEAALLQGIVDRQAGWLLLLADLQDRLGRVGDVWLEQLAMVYPAGSPPKLRLVGCMLDQSTPAFHPIPATSDRVKALLAEIASSPYVAAVEAERIDSHHTGLLGFTLILKIDPTRPL